MGGTFRVEGTVQGKAGLGESDAKSSLCIHTALRPQGHTHREKGQTPASRILDGRRDVLLGVSFSTGSSLSQNFLVLVQIVSYFIDQAHTDS